MTESIMSDKAFANLLSNDWVKELKKLPKYQKKELKKAGKILHQIELYKYDCIKFDELKNNLKTIIAESSGQ